MAFTSKDQKKQAERLTRDSRNAQDAGDDKLAAKLHRLAMEASLVAGRMEENENNK